MALNLKVRSLDAALHRSELDVATTALADCIRTNSQGCDHVKLTGSLPLIGINTFFRNYSGEITTTIELIRSTDDEKAQQIANVEGYRDNRNALGADSLKSPQATAQARENFFESLLEAVKYNSLGQISHALHKVGGKYRRNM